MKEDTMVEPAGLRGDAGGFTMATTEKARPDKATVILCLGAKEAAKALGLSEATFRRGVKSRQFPRPIRFGGRVLWEISALRRTIAAARRAAEEADQAEGQATQCAADEIKAR